MAVSDAIMDAISDFERLYNALEKNEESKVGASFRSRCREIPTLIEDVGLIPALSFCYAKATKERYENIRKLIEEGGTIDEGDNISKGYAAFLYFVLKRLKTLNLISDNSVAEPIEALKELRDLKGSVARKLLRPYIIQLKKLSEAVFKPEGEGK